ncbi:MAG: helix-turn-helix transcriptional regulator [Candidatus Thiodiazotropha endolucinida]
MLNYMKALSKTELQFQANLKRLISATRIEHTALAKQSGVALRTIQSLLSGERGPSVVMTEKLAKAFKVESWHMLYSEIDPETMRSKQFNKLIRDYLNLSEENRKEIAQAAHSLAKLAGLKEKNKPEFPTPITKKARKKK